MTEAVVGQHSGVCVCQRAGGGQETHLCTVQVAEQRVFGQYVFAEETLHTVVWVTIGWC